MSATRPRGDVWGGVWRLADPKISLASIASMFLGACAAAREGPLAWGWLAAAVVGILALETAKNASGEVFDWDTGTDSAVAPEDRSPFSGGKRVLVDGLLDRRQTWTVAAAGYGLGAATGLAIAAAREPAVLWLGLAGVACAWFYHAPPLKLSSRGLGEAAVALCYGPLIAAGTFLVQRGRWPSEYLPLFAVLGLLIAAFLWINEFPDYRADLGAGKRNLVVRLGRPRAARAFAALVAAAALAVAFLPATGMPKTVWLGALFVPLAAAAARRLLDSPEVTALIVPAQAWTLIAFLLYSAGAGAGLLVAP